MKKRNIGTSFDSLLREDGIYEEVTATAIKRVLARQVEAENSTCAELLNNVSCAVCGWPFRLRGTPRRSCARTHESMKIMRSRSYRIVIQLPDLLRLHMNH
jgi:hypothetical protein